MGSSLRIAAFSVLIAAAPIALFHWLAGARLLNPWGLVASLLVVPLIALYLLKRQRAPAPVSTLMFWSIVQRELEGSSPFQALRRRLLLVLQLLLLFLLVYALADPAIAGRSDQGRSRILVLDVSCSMRARDQEGRARIDWAREEARRIIRGMGADDEALIIAVGERARTLQGWTDRRDVLERALEQARASDTGTRLEEGLILASSAMKSARREPELVVLSDGASPPPSAALALPERLSFRPVGSRGDNLAIVRAALSARDDGPGFALFVSARVYGAAAVSASLEVRREGRPLAARVLELEPGRARSVSLRIPPLEPGPVSLELVAEPGSGFQDPLPEDNRAWVVVPDVRPWTAAVFGPDNPILDRALAADERLSLRRAATPTPAALEDAALVIYDRVDPGSGAGLPALIIAPPRLPESSGLSLGEACGPGVVSSWDREHPALRFAELEAVALRRARGLILREGARSMIEIDGRSVAASPRLSGERALVLSFSLEDTSWPLKLSFPVFMRNAVGFLAGPDASTGHPLSLRPGARFEARLRAGERGRLILPGGEALSLTARGRRAETTRTRRAGVYRLTRGERVSWMAVNICDEAESDIAPRPKLSVGRRAFEPQAQDLRRELWWGVALLALVLVLLEYAAWLGRW